MKTFKKGSEINDQDEDIKKRKLFVKGLPMSCDKHKLIKVFSQFGIVDKAYILYDHLSGASRGFGFVEFINEENLLKALQRPIMIDSKLIKCSRVFLKQEYKQGPAGSEEEEKEVQVSTKKQCKKVGCKNPDTNAMEDTKTKESSTGSSCEKMPQNLPKFEFAEKARPNCSTQLEPPTQHHHFNLSSISQRQGFGMQHQPHQFSYNTDPYSMYYNFRAEAPNEQNLAYSHQPHQHGYADEDYEQDDEDEWMWNQAHWGYFQPMGSDQSVRNQCTATYSRGRVWSAGLGEQDFADGASEGLREQYSQAASHIAHRGTASSNAPGAKPRYASQAKQSLYKMF